MYIRFVLDPFVPHGTNKVIRRVVRDLRKIFTDVTYSVESNEELSTLYDRETVPTSVIFQRKVHMFCKGFTFYIVNANLVWRRKRVFGLSLPDRCVVGLKDIPRNNSTNWSAKVWDLILHELGHSMGLINKHRARLSISTNGTGHCINNCSMSEDESDSIWTKRAYSRYKRESPYCEDCLKYLLAKDV